jgi:cytochrome c-type biogenesis protein CcmH
VRRTRATRGNRAAGWFRGGIIAALAARVLATAAVVTLGAAALLLPATAGAQAAPGAAPTAEEAALMKTERFRALASELRCLVCQNQTLEDSNAPLAQDLRREVARLMAEGRDDAAVKSYLVDRYGEFVLYRPPFSARNALLWVGPFVLLLIGAAAWWRLGRRRPQASPHSADATLEKVDELLGR